MARLWSSGFELGSNTSGVEWINCAGAAATVQTTTARSGTYAGKITGPSSGTRAGWLMQYKTGTSSALKFRFYLAVTALPNAETTIAVFGTGTATLAAQSLDWRLTLNASGILNFYDVNRVPAQITSTTAIAADGSWHRVELAFIDPDVSSGLLGWDLYLDGTQEGSHYANGISADPIHFSLGVNLNADTATSGTWYFDDAAVNDGAGTAQNGLPGAGSIVHAMPGGAGDFAEGALGGSSPAATAWQSMDEVPPNDGVDFWTLQTDASANSTSADRVDVTLALPGGFSATSVTLVQVGARISCLSAASASWVPRIKSQASGTILEGTTVTIAVTAWNTNDDTATTRAYKLTSYTDPQAGGAWTQALLGAAQIGARAPDGNPDVQISTLWALIEYVPAVGGGSGVPFFFQEEMLTGGLQALVGF